MRQHQPIFFLVLILSVAGICHITLFLKVQAVEPDRILAIDSVSYVNPAQAILKTGRFTHSPDRPNFPEFERTPGYPLFIASIFYVFGEHYAPLIIAQILVSLGTIVITYLIGAKLWGVQGAIISALLLSLDFLSFVSAQKVLTETLFTFFLSLTVLVGTYVLDNSQHVICWGLGCGVCLALTTLIRPINYYLLFPVLIFFITVWKMQFHWPWKKVWAMAFIFSMPWFILVGGWQVRNYRLTGSAEFSGIQGINLLFFRGAEIIARRDGVPFIEVQHRLGYERYKALKRQPDQTGRSLAQINLRIKHEGLRLICQYPWLFIRSQASGAFRMLFETDWNEFLSYIKGEYKEHSGPGGDFLHLSLDQYIPKWVIGKTGYFTLFMIAASYLLVLYTGMGVSIWQELRMRSQLFSSHVFLWTIVLYFIFISAGLEAYARFRIPILPLMCLYAGRGVYVMQTGWKSTERNPVKFTHP